MLGSKVVRLPPKFALLIIIAFPTSNLIAADPLEPYLSKTTYSIESSILSSDCSYVDSNVAGLAEALSIDFILDNGMLAIHDFELKDRRPLIGCDDLLEVRLDEQGSLTSALFSTSGLTIISDDSTIYNLSAGFNESRKPLAESGKYLFDAINYSERNCSRITQHAVPVSPTEYLREIKSIMEGIDNDIDTGYVDNPSESAETNRNGPVAHLFYESALNYAASAYLQEFNDFSPDGFDGFIATWEGYQSYMGALCNVYMQKDSKVSLYLQATLLTNLGIEDWLAHPSKWGEYEYIDTGRNVIAAPSPPGLEYYKKYVTGGGVIIVAGAGVDDGALLAARDAFIYMTSARPEIRGILQRNHARFSLFLENASELPEYGPDFAGEIGGFAQTRIDANFTGNANWLCYPGNWEIGGNPAIHELGHVINHLVFEETNETYWYERIIELANDARERGVSPPGSPLGEYWAQAVEGYIMNKGDRFKSYWPTRDDIKINHPGLYELLTRYLPTEEWDYCPGVEQYM